MIFISWDWKAQPDIDEINGALGSVKDARLYPINTGSDEYAVAVAQKDTPLSIVQEAYDKRYEEL